LTATIVADEINHKPRGLDKAVGIIPFFLFLSLFLSSALLYLFIPSLINQLMDLFAADAV